MMPGPEESDQILKALQTELLHPILQLQPGIFSQFYAKAYNFTDVIEPAEFQKALALYQIIGEYARGRIRQYFIEMDLMAILVLIAENNMALYEEIEEGCLREGKLIPDHDMHKTEIIQYLKVQIIRLAMVIDEFDKILLEEMNEVTP